MESPRTRKSVKSLNPKLLEPKKSFTHKIKSSEEKNNMHQKKQQEKKELFSILKKPEYFEGENNDSDSIVLDNSDQNLNMLSNKNILQLNEITKELKNTFLGKGNKNFQNLNKKSFILDDIEKYERTNNSENNSSNFLEKEIYRVLSKKGYVYDSFDEEELLDEEIEIYRNLNPDSNIVNLKIFLFFYVYFIICFIFLFF
jgi:tRNA U34 5-carboxymethylaminomethyl modifying GTPase MnmE/TrmE